MACLGKYMFTSAPLNGWFIGYRKTLKKFTMFVKCNCCASTLWIWYSVAKDYDICIYGIIHFLNLRRLEHWYVEKWWSCTGVLGNGFQGEIGDSQYLAWVLNRSGDQYKNCMTRCGKAVFVPPVRKQRKHNLGFFFIFWIDLVLGSQMVIGRI